MCVFFRFGIMKWDFMYRENTIKFVSYQISIHIHLLHCRHSHQFHGIASISSEFINSVKKKTACVRYINGNIPISQN